MDRDMSDPRCRAKGCKAPATETDQVWDEILYCLRHQKLFDARFAREMEKGISDMRAGRYYTMEEIHVEEWIKESPGNAKIKKDLKALIRTVPDFPRPGAPREDGPSRAGAVPVRGSLKEHHE